MGKGEIARYEQFLLFQQCFQKACFPGVSKGVIVWEWVNASLTAQAHIMAVDYAHVFPCFLTPVQTQISFQKHRLLFSHASAEVRGENIPERTFTSTRYQTPNHQVWSPAHSPLSTKPSGWGPVKRNKAWFLRV